MIQKPKGTYDVSGKQGKTILRLESILQTIMTNYHYEYFRTPIFEASELFHRGVGETTDIVSKETYDFKDRGDRDMTLRPEGTAGIVRSFIENKHYGNAIQPIKTWYYGPMYRYERPQSGRFREFYQFGVEVFGSDDPAVDAEIISIPVHFYRLLGLKGIVVNINSLGDSESRQNYREALVSYFKPHLSELCEDCQIRYEKNPLRILDCKVDHELECMKNTPRMTEYLNETSKKHFEKVQEYLTELGIDFVVNPSIVRGLDYYTHTVFEVEASVEGFGSQNVLCAGGRYNHLVETVGGPSTPGVGFALGMERLLTALEFEHIDIVGKEEVDVYLIPVSEEQKGFALHLATILRLSGFIVEMDYMNRNIKSNFKQSERLESKYVIIIGEEEATSKVLTVKNNKTKEEDKVKLSTIIRYLDEQLAESDSCGCGEEHCHEHDDHDCEEHECACGDHDCDCDGDCGHDCDCKNHECGCGDDCDCKEHECDCENGGCQECHCHDEEV